MGTTIDKLNKVLETKNNIKSAIINKGIEVNDSDTFASYAEKIGEITTGHAGEMINVSLKTNQSSHGDLVGATIIISYRDVSESHAWNGSELTFEIPQYAVYTISVTDVAGYRTPSDVIYTAVSSNSRTISLQYDTCLTTIDITNVEGLTANVTYNSSTTTVNDGTVLKIPMGTSVTVTPVTNVDSYNTPAAVTETLNTASKTIVLEYEKVVVITSTIRLNMTITDPVSMVTGDVNGAAIQAIRNNSHRYLGKYTGTGQMTICQLDDSDSTKYFDGTTANLSSGGGDVFMRLPKFFYKATNVSTNIWDISFAYGDSAPDTTWNTWDGNDLIGVYEAVSLGANIYSCSGTTSSGSISQSLFKTYARNRGTGYSLVKWKHHSIMCFLFYALYGNTNCQAICGSGTSSYDKSTGATNSLGMEDTTSSNGNSMSINFWGLENWWGNKYEFVDNVVLNSDLSWAITEDDGSVRNVTAGINSG